MQPTETRFGQSAYPAILRCRPPMYVRARLIQTCVRAVINRPATQRVNTQMNHCHNSFSGVVKPHTNVRPLGIINKGRIMAAELSQLLRPAASKHLKAERDLLSKELHTKMISSLLNHGVHHLQSKRLPCYY